MAYFYQFQGQEYKIQHSISPTINTMPEFSILTLQHSQITRDNKRDGL